MTTAAQRNLWGMSQGGGVQTVAHINSSGMTAAQLVEKDSVPDYTKRSQSALKPVFRPLHGHTDARHLKTKLINSDFLLVKTLKAAEANMKNLL